MPASTTHTSRRARKKDITRNTIIDTALALFEAEGFDAVSMERIAATADVAKATLYSYFPVKDAIIAAFLHRESRSHDQEVAQWLALPGSTRQRLYHLYDGIARWSESYRHYLARYIAYRLAQPNWYRAKDEERSGFHRYLAHVLDAGYQAQELRQDIPPPLLLVHLQSLQLTTTLLWLQQPDSALAPMLRQVVDLFLDGVEQRS